MGFVSLWPSAVKGKNEGRGRVRGFLLLRGFSRVGVELVNRRSRFNSVDVLVCLGIFAHHGLCVFVAFGS